MQRERRKSTSTTQSQILWTFLLRLVESASSSLWLHCIQTGLVTVDLDSYQSICSLYYTVALSFGVLFISHENIVLTKVIKVTSLKIGQASFWDVDSKEMTGNEGWDIGNNIQQRSPSRHRFTAGLMYLIFFPFVFICFISARSYLKASNTNAQKKWQNAVIWR